MKTSKAIYIERTSKTNFRVCAMYENIAVVVKFDKKYNEWAVGYAPRDGWWPTEAEAIEAAKSIINSK